MLAAAGSARRPAPGASCRRASCSAGRAGAAAGWGGDRYELWRRGDDAALIMRWRWDTPRDEAEFEARLREVMGDRGVVVRRGGTVTLAVAPDRDLAERLAGS